MTKIMAALRPAHFLWRMDGAVAVIQLNRPERKNPLTFKSYAELRDTFRDLAHADDVHAVVFLPNGGNFCSGGDAVDGGDDRLAAMEHGLDQVAGHARESEQLLCVHGDQRADDLVHVAAGAEIAAVGQEHHGVDVVGISELAKRVA